MKKFIFALIVSLASISASAHPASEQHVKYLTIGAGGFDVNREELLEYRLEYRHDYIWKSLYPSIGINGTDKGSIYSFVGLNYDWNFFRNLYITPNFAVGAYDRNGGTDLGGVLNFRSGVEFSAQFNNKHRVGIAVSHISNASIYDRNPGEESVVLNYSVPLSTFTGK